MSDVACGQVRPLGIMGPGTLNRWEGEAARLLPSRMRGMIVVSAKGCLGSEHGEAPSEARVRREQYLHSVRQCALGLGAPVGRAQTPRLDNMTLNPATPAGLAGVSPRSTLGVPGSVAKRKAPSSAGGSRSTLRSVRQLRSQPGWGHGPWPLAGPSASLLTPAPVAGSRPSGGSECQENRAGSRVRGGLGD